MAKAGRGSEQVMVRLPDGMRDRIKAVAEQNGRSMNAEIVAALEEAFPDLSIFRDELRIVDELEEIQIRLDRIKAARIAEVSESYSEQYLAERAAKRAEGRKELGRNLKGQDKS